MNRRQKVRPNWLRRNKTVTSSPPALMNWIAAFQRHSQSLAQLNLNELKEQVELSAKGLAATEAELTRKEAKHVLLKPSWLQPGDVKDKVQKINAILTRN